MHCRHCEAVESCNLAQMTTRLQTEGMLRRAENPDAHLIAEVAKSAAANWPCRRCRRVGLHVQLSEDEDADEWAIARRCSACKAIIPPERLELFPSAALCAACQQQADAGDDDQQREFCPHCGGLMQVRQSTSGGIARYVNKCSDCGRTS